MKKTKIIATLGPATSSEEVIKELIKKGMNCARINMSHGTHESNSVYINLVKKLREKLKQSVAVIIDTKGPELRIGNFKNGSITLEKGKLFTLVSKDIEGTESSVSINYKNLWKDVKTGSKILINNGLVELTVTDIKPGKITTKIKVGGPLLSRKSMFVPGVKLAIPFLTEADKKDLLYAIKNDADYIAASFVNRKKDLKDMRAFLDANGGNNIKIISKIESVEGLINCEEIIKNSDAVMVARGDLGVELSFEKLPPAQKKLIKASKKLFIPSITATEMLESMIEKTRPTRAETTDVANAIYDDTSVVMLSGETSIGKQPALVVETMSKICENTEADVNFKGRFSYNNNKFKADKHSISEIITNSGIKTALDADAKFIVTFTDSGRTARMLSTIRPGMPIIAITQSPKVFQQLSLYFGVIPVLMEKNISMEEMFNFAKQYVKKEYRLKKNDIIVITSGFPTGVSTETNFIKVERI